MCPSSSFVCESQEKLSENVLLFFKQAKSDNVFLFLNQVKCKDGSNSGPEGGILNAVLNRWCEGRNCYDFAKSAKFGKGGKNGQT